MSDAGQGGSDGEAKRRLRGPRPDLCQRYARKEFAAGLPAILQCFIEQASKGSIPHAKALMTLSGLDREGPVGALPPKKRQRGARTLSEMLLMELRRQPGKPECD